MSWGSWNPFVQCPERRRAGPDELGRHRSVAARRRTQAARLAKLSELLDVRAAAYAQAEVCVDTDACSIDDVVSAIVDGLEAEASATDGPGAKD